ncbi:hypothetical protein HZC00_04645 [Candidatus Kaiserbacteria bacterium]|nr:hypothetical protein [Candidatus Kaiserbacteria bacterium]
MGNLFSRVSRLAIMPAVFSCVILLAPGFALAAAAVDGQGAMVVSPISVFANATQSFNFTFTAGSGDFSDSSTVTFSIPSGWSAPQKTTSSSAGYVTISSSTCTNNKPHTGTTDISVSGNTVTVSAMSCNHTKEFVLSYNNAVVPSTAGDYTFTTNTDNSPLSGSGVAITAQPVVTVNKLNQTITFNTLTGKTYGDVDSPYLDALHRSTRKILC